MISSSHVEQRQDPQDGEDHHNRALQSRAEDHTIRTLQPRSHQLPRESIPSSRESSTVSRELEPALQNSHPDTSTSFRESSPLNRSPENLTVQSSGGPTDLSIQNTNSPPNFSTSGQVTAENLSIQAPIGPRNLQISSDPRTTQSPWTQTHSYSWWKNKGRASPPKFPLPPLQEKSPQTRPIQRDRVSPTLRTSPTHITHHRISPPSHITQKSNRTPSPRVPPSLQQGSSSRITPPTNWRDELERRLPPENTHKNQHSPTGLSSQEPQSSSRITAQSATRRPSPDPPGQEHLRKPSFSGITPSIHISPVPFGNKSPEELYREAQLPFMETETLLRERYLSRRDSGPWQSLYPRERFSLPRERPPLPVESLPLSGERFPLPRERFPLSGERFPSPGERLPSLRDRVPLPDDRLHERIPYPQTRNPLTEPISLAQEIRSQIYNAAFLQSLPYHSSSHPLIFPHMTSGLLPRSSFGLFRPGMPAFPRPSFHPSTWPAPPSSIAQESHSPMEKKKEESSSSRQRKHSPDRPHQSPDESRAKSRSPPQPQPPKGSELIVRDGKDVRDHSLKHRILTRSPKSSRSHSSTLIEDPWKGFTPRSGSQSAPTPQHHRAATLTAASGITGGKPISSTRPYLPPPRLTQTTAAEGSGEEGSVAVGQPGYPAHFTRGSLIQLANGEMKQVEELVTEDFVNSAKFSPDVRIDHSTVVKLEPVPSTGSVLLSFSVGKQRIQVTVEAALEHPFFVFNQGWSSSNPELTSARYHLTCNQLKVGDVCISLTHKANTTSPSSPSSLLIPSTTSDRRRSSSSSIISNRSSSSTPSKQVVFHDTPSIIRIDPSSPPICRLGDTEDGTVLTTTSPPISTPSPTDKKARNVSVLVSVTTSTATPVSSPSRTSPSQESINLKRHWSGEGDNGHNHKPKKIKTGDKDI